MAGFGDRTEFEYDQHGHHGRDDQHEFGHRQDEYSHTGGAVVELVKDFLVYFRRMISEKNLYEIQNLYENTFIQLGEKYYKSCPWPEVEEVAPIVQKDEVFLILYQELYYRHVYAKVQRGPSLQQRFESYGNYCNLFNYILSAERPVPLELPNIWLWEIIDEFIYQFQSFCQYRSRFNKLSAEEIDDLKKHPTIWNVHSVLNVLHSLVEKSNINRQLEVYVSGGDPDTVAGEFGRHPLYKMLGYFSLIGLLRLHSLLGDYYQALKVLENIELNKKSLYSRVPACQITTYYYVGFAYMMMRRYADAIRTFCNILMYIQRTKIMYQQRTFQYDQVNKQTQQMYVLLAMCMVLHPQCIDESIQGLLRDNCSDRMLRMQKGDLQEFEQSFSFAAPKFLSPVPPIFDHQMMDGPHVGFEPLLHQMRVFMDEVREQKMLATIRSYLRLYTTMPIAKLATFLDMPESDFRNWLFCFKHKMKNVVWTHGTSSLDGEFQSGSEVDFYIDKNMIHIADTKVSRRYGDFFIRQIHKLEELNRALKSLQV